MSDLDTCPRCGSTDPNRCEFPFNPSRVGHVHRQRSIREIPGWFSRHNPITVYYGDTLVAEYEGRFKGLRAWLRTKGPRP